MPSYGAFRGLEHLAWPTVHQSVHQPPVGLHNESFGMLMAV